MGWVCVITNTGNAAIENALATGNALNLNAVKIGTGYVQEANMRAATDMNSAVGTGTIVRKKGLDTGVQITLKFGAQTSSALIKEVGLFGTIDGSTVLFALFQNADGVDVPATADFPDYSYQLSAVFDIDDLDEITITVSNTAFLDWYQGTENAGKFMVVDTDGYIKPVTVPFANGVSF